MRTFNEIKVNLTDYKVIRFWHFFPHAKLYNHKNVIGITISIIKEICYRVNYKSKTTELNSLETTYVWMVLTLIRKLFPPETIAVCPLTLIKLNLPWQL